MDKPMKTIQIIVRNLDVNGSACQKESEINQVQIPFNINTEEIKNIICHSLCIKNYNMKIIKMRTSDHEIIPFKTVLRNFPIEKVFVLEIKDDVGCKNLGKFETSGATSHHHPIIDLELMELEKKIIAIENDLPELVLNEYKIMERTSRKITNCAEHLERIVQEYS
ncbi:uncharacterized protein LOC106649824 isoform X1 [Trichogramma pretiosum]|uniref:uncharacterized protein LOC106649824 isoform X1 n=1 Tax=Trichogramma pretiosum TaxID=7493 RepID=UPI000C71893F|nr:uncharacterized protein LOC106649824 isoform X1 [Trichogramma pretiosum]XP_023318347.1 uncharacterized protein LOC106649824 isoform X1 [Trichogramma pretiosum]